jgi:exopolysaccharide biosynthesis polyprenyl glycosylphosphotransferase
MEVQPPNPFGFLELLEVSEANMATSGFWQKLSASPELAGQRETTSASDYGRLRGKAALWIALDVITVVCGAVLATLYERNTGPVAGARGLIHGTLIQNRSIGILSALLCGFTITLVVISRRLQLYSPLQLNNILNEQGRSIQACFIARLFLTGTLYLVKAEDIPREIVLITLGMVTISLSVRRLVYRLAFYRRFERGQGMRNVLIVGTGPEALAMRHHIDSIRHLGYNFKGFIDFPGHSSQWNATSGEIVGTLETLFDSARKQFVDEIFFVAPCERGVIQRVLEQSRAQRVDLRVVPDLYDGLAWKRPIEYIGQFPTIPLHSGHVPEIGLVLKRVLDILIAAAALVVLFPLMLAIAIAVRLNSGSPILYNSERIGKKGRVFRCTKFRTMVRDADKRRAEVMHMNERDGVLFKIANDPRITRVGRFLRKYSLDELPQFFNVLVGEMSVVGPRPPLASEVQEYKLSYLRRLDMNPGITGLWQVQARQDPSFDSYISLDVAYVENWNLLLDLKILVRTIGVVLRGTGA